MQTTLPLYSTPFKAAEAAAQQPLMYGCRIAIYQEPVSGQFTPVPELYIPHPSRGLNKVGVWENSDEGLVNVALEAEAHEHGCV